MKQRILFTIFLAISLCSWVGRSDGSQVKPKDSTQKSCIAPPAKKQAAKKSGMLLYETLIHHLF